METTNRNIGSYNFSDSQKESGFVAAPRKKRTKLLHPMAKPKPSAAKTTPPCTECGRRFWSDKALFGHMRCHPERQWRGIIPPPTLCRDDPTSLTEEDHDVAVCLLMLANAPRLRHESGGEGLLCNHQK